MKIEIWSDFACPFCYLGSTRLKKALAELGFEVETIYHSFELDPTVKSTNQNQNAIEHLANKLGTNKNQARERLESIAKALSEEGLKYNYENALVANTQLAHQLIYFARKNNPKLEEALRQRLFKAYFEDGLNIGNVEILVELANEVGLDKQAVKEALENELHSENLYEDKLQSQLYEIRSVPQFIINDKYKIVGAQSQEYFSQALAQINKEFQEPLTTLNISDDDSCGDDGCKI